MQKRVSSEGNPVQRPWGASRFAGIEKSEDRRCEKVRSKAWEAGREDRPLGELWLSASLGLDLCVPICQRKYVEGLSEPSFLIVPSYFVKTLYVYVCAHLCVCMCTSCMKVPVEVSKRCPFL